MATKKPRPELAHYATKEISPFMVEYVAWLKETTGYDVDPLSVQLSGVLRPEYQSRRRSKKQATLDSIAVPAKPTRTRKAAIK